MDTGKWNLQETLQFIHVYFRKGKDLKIITCNLSKVSAENKWQIKSI